jgi:hypothetical protein
MKVFFSDFFDVDQVLLEVYAAIGGTTTSMKQLSFVK